MHPLKKDRPVSSLMTQKVFIIRVFEKYYTESGNDSGKCFLQNVISGFIGGVGVLEE